MSMSHHEVCDASMSPAIAPIKNEIYAARFTAPGDARPLAVRRVGPTRSASVPRIPSD